jgi:formylglycine-generating enzyme required for sulfatase activity
LAPGTPLEDFIVEHEIARAGSTITYRVRDPAAGGHFLLREYAPPGGVVRRADGSLAADGENATAALALGVARFLVDAARAATLQHDSLARTIRGFRSNGTAYQLLACPPGKSLGELLRAGQAPDAAGTARLARAMLDALEYLHARKLAHHELAPDQILVTDAGGALLSGGGAPESFATLQPATEDERIADPYAAIEQLGGGAKTGPWTDIYRLAATLYHCLAGRPPPSAFERRAAVRAGAADPLPSLADLAGRDAAGRELRTLIGRGLQLEAAQRPQSLREWRARITPAHDEQAPQVRKRGRSDRLPGLLAGFVLLVLLAGGVYLLSRDRDGAPATQPSPADRGASQAETERWRQALETNAVVGYRAFIEEFPDSPRVAQAREYIAHLEDQAWPAVLEENTWEAFEAHLETFPDGRYATAALARIEAFRQEAARLAREAAESARQEEVAWQAAQAAGTVAALDAFLAAWPGGAHAAEARALRQQMQTELNDAAGFELARERHTIADYRAYIADFPAGRHMTAALQAIDGLTLRPGKSFRDCAACPEMMVVPAGAFWQGSADASPLAISLEKPRRRVVIAAPFAIGVDEVTMEQWDACVAEGGCELRPEDNGWGRGNRPVILVSWNDARQYAAWLSQETGQRYDLPSESEWEYAARAGEESDWLGGGADAVCAYGNIAGAETGFDWRHPDCSDRTALATAISGTFKPNAFGLFDVIGNVAEWTLDCMNLSYLEAPTDGSAWSRGMCGSRMTRGGSWFTGTREARLPARFNLHSGDRNDFTGFRLVRRVEPQ